MVFGRPPRRTRTVKDCKPVEKFKQAFSNNLQIMETNMQGLFLLTVVSTIFSNVLTFMIYAKILHDKRRSIEYTLMIN